MRECKCVLCVSIKCVFMSVCVYVCACVCVLFVCKSVLGAMYV